MGGLQLAVKLTAPTANCPLPLLTANRKLHMKNTALVRDSSFLHTAIFVAVCVAAAAWAMPILSFVFGTGWLAPTLLAVSLFGVFLAFKRLIFRDSYSKSAPDGEAELIEYLVRENATGHPDEEKIETELLENALHLKQIKLRDCMTPRREIVAVDVHAGLDELRQLFTESNLSRILVTDGGDLDRALGYVHVQQMFGRPKNIRSIVLPITFVPATMAVNDLLQKLIRSRSSISCVVDEYGSVAGLVTMEDALEQLFGDIDDEHDQAEFIETQVGEGEYLFSGRLEIDYLNDKYPHLALPEGDYQTLSGYLVAAAQDIPEQGARLELGGKIFVPELVSDRKIETVRVLESDEL